MLNSGALNSYALNQWLAKPLATGDIVAPLPAADALAIAGEVLNANLTIAPSALESNGYTGWVLSANLDAPVHSISGTGQEFGINFAIIDNPACEMHAAIASGEVSSGAILSPVNVVDATHFQTHIYIGNATAPMHTVSSIGGMATYADIDMPRPIVSGACGSNAGLATMPLALVSGGMVVGISITGNIAQTLSVVSAVARTGYTSTGEVFATNAEAIATVANQTLITAHIAMERPDFIGSIVSDGFVVAEIVQPTSELNGAIMSELSNIFTTYAMNIENAKLTQYMDYPALAMAKLGGVYLSVAPDGIYLMDGDSDDGKVIDARVRFGMDDMGTDNLKRVQYAYVGSRGSVQMRMLTDSDKETTTYDCTHDGNGIKTSRIKMGKGTKSRYWQPEIVGNQFDIDSISLEAEALSRKVA